MLQIFQVILVQVVGALLNHDAACSVVGSDGHCAVFNAGRRHNLDNFLGHIVKGGPPALGLQLQFLLINLKFHLDSPPSIFNLFSGSIVLQLRLRDGSAQTVHFCNWFPQSGRSAKYGKSPPTRLRTLCPGRYIYRFPGLHAALSPHPLPSPAGTPYFR